MRASIFLATALLLTQPGCTPSTEDLEVRVDGSDRYAAEVEAILSFEQGVFDAQIAGDFEAWLSFFAEDAIVMAPNVPALKSKQAIREWQAPFFGQYELHEKTDEREIEVAGDWAFIRAHWTWTLTPKSGGEVMIETGNSIWILRRPPDGSWKIARVIYNRDTPIPCEE